MCLIAKTETTLQLEKALWNTMIKMGTFGCFEVTIGWYGKERCDFITYDTKGIWKCYEIKTSVEDFHSKAALTFCGHFNYFVMTKEVYEKVKDEIPKDIGVYVQSCNEVMSIKRAKRQELSIDEKTLKDSFIRSLFRDAEKYYNMNDEDKIAKLKRQVARIKREKDDYYNKYFKLQHSVIDKLGYEVYESLRN